MIGKIPIQFVHVRKQASPRECTCTCMVEDNIPKQ